MARAPWEISSLNVLFKELERAMDSNDVREVKNLLRGEQVNEEDMEKLSKATDVFYHLQKHGYIGECNLVLLKNLFQQIGRGPLQRKVEEFQKIHNSTISRRSTKKLKSKSHRKSPYRLKAKAYFAIEETRCKKGNGTEKDVIDHETRNLEKLRTEVEIKKLEGEAQELELKKLQRKVQITQEEIKLDAVTCLRQHINDVCKRITEEKDPALIQQLTERLKQFKATLEIISSGSLIFWLSFLSELDVQSFWQVYKDGKVDDTLTALFVTSELRALAEAACCTVRVTLEIDEGEYMKLKEKLHVTKATEYAVMHNAEMYCEYNNVEVDNFREILSARLYEIGECLYENITMENVGKLYPSWLDQKKIPNIWRWYDSTAKPYIVGH
ncbi:uncharacterized protein [Ptychodera flava]|uniref:uncharacterized protein n=1 Tax=Ptychodera flava TaxID=63121 RepID=UPI003969E9B8